MNKKKNEKKNEKKHTKTTNLLKDLLKTPNEFKKIANQTEDFTNTVKENIGYVKEGFYSLKDIGGAIKTLTKSIGSFFKIIFWVIKFVLYIIGELLNPFNLFNDLFTGFSNIPHIIINVSLRIITIFSKYIANNILHPIMNKAFGWDIKMTDKDGKPIENKGDTKCYKPNEGKLPNTVIMSTVLLPPLGIFMRFGLNRWIEILICSALTMLYYIPGVSYAFFLLYSK
jgi:uncharacterized membrane protein YqaE (UPF0057 family)